MRDSVMKHMKKYILFFLLLHAPLHAVFHYAEVLEKEDTKIVLLGDYHRDYAHHSVTKNQRYDLIHYAKKHNAFLIAEDHMGNTRLGCLTHIALIGILHELLSKKNHTPGNQIINVTPLSHLCHFATKHHVANRSCEFRSPWINTPTSRAVVTAILAQIQKSFFYQNHKKIMEEKLQEYLFHNAKNKTAAECHLLDLHAVVQLWQEIERKKHKLFIICVGSYHIAGISDLCQKALGYKKTSTTTPFHNEKHLLGGATVPITKKLTEVEL